MLETVDRIQLAVHDLEATTQAWVRLLDARLLREDKLAVLGARRSVLGAGTSEIELLEPDGVGPVADFLEQNAAPGLFAAGFSAPDPSRLRALLASSGAEVAERGEQLFCNGASLGLRGLHVVISPARERERVGLLERLYEATYLVADAPAATARFAECFGLRRESFVPIESSNFGYAGTLTLFDPLRLDRVEIIDPRDRSKTMGRFFTKRGPSLYMCYAETDRADEIRARAQQAAPHDWTGPEEGRVDNLFLHPKALGGVMLGVSRSTFAWSWSGSPERISP